MVLNIFENAKFIKIETLFEVRKGKRLTKANMTLGGTPYLGAIDKNNGVSNFIEKEALFPGNVISVNYDGSVGEAFYQPNPFWASDAVNVLIPKFKLTELLALFFVTLIKFEKYRFNYGRKWHQKRMQNSELLLPITKEEEINWSLILEFMTKLSNSPSMFNGFNSASVNSSVPIIDTTVWMSFKYKDIFEIKKGKRLIKANMTSGATPYIGASDMRNGLTAHTGQQPIHLGNTISLSYNGSVAEAFYQSIPYWATDDVNVLYPKFKMTPEIGLFICAIIRLEKYRFNYGRKWHLERMRESVIKLPIQKNGAPDFDFMERYVKSLPYSSQVN